MRTPLQLLISYFLLAVAPAMAEKTTYDDHILPIFENSCVNCHNPDKKKGDLDLTSYSATLAGGSGGKVVIAGEGADSRLFLTTSHSREPYMPPKGERLSKKEINLIRAWIDGGLLETKSSTAQKRQQTKITFDASLSMKPSGPAPMPQHLLLEPQLTPTKATAIHAMSSSPWAPVIAITSQGQILLYHTEELELIGILPFPKGEPTALSFHPSGKYLCAAGGTPGKSGTSYLWDISDGQIIASASKEYDSILSTSIRADLKAVATGSPSRLLKTWSTHSGELEHSIKKHSDWVTALSYSNDGVLLASADRNGGLYVWESHSGQLLHTLRGHQDRITAVKWSADSNFLATSSEDGSIRFWDMNTGKQIKKIDAHKTGVLAFDWAADGSAISTGRDLKIKLWKPNYSLAKEIKAASGLINCCCYSYDLKRFFTADYDGNIVVWNSSNYEKIGQLSSIPGSISARKIRTLEQLSSLPQKLIRAADELKKLTELHGLQQHTNLQLQQQIQQSQNQLKQHAGELKQFQQELKRLSPSITQLAQQRSKLSKAREQAQLSILTLEQQLRTTGEQATRVTQQSLDLTQQLDAAEIQRQALTTETANNEQGHAIKQQISTLKLRLAANKAETDRIAKQQSQYIAQQTKQKQHLAKLQAHLAKLQPQWHKLIASRSAYQQHSKTSQQNTARHKKALDHQQKKLSELQQKLTSVEVKQKNAQQQLSKLNQQQRQLQRRILKLDAASINSALIKAKQKLDQYQSTRQQLHQAFISLSRLPSPSQPPPQDHTHLLKIKSQIDQLAPPLFTAQQHVQSLQRRYTRAYAKTLQPLPSK